MSSRMGIMVGGAVALAIAMTLGTFGCSSDDDPPETASSSGVPQGTSSGSSGTSGASSSGSSGTSGSGASSGGECTTTAQCPKLTCNCGILANAETQRCANGVCAKKCADVAGCE